MDLQPTMTTITAMTATTLSMFFCLFTHREVAHGSTWGCIRLVGAQLRDVLCKIVAGEKYMYIYTYMFNVPGNTLFFCAVSKHHVLCKQALSLCGATPHSNSQKGLSHLHTLHVDCQLPNSNAFFPH